jgi:uncharacterized protein YqjF (DUF2071 family)
MARPFLTAHWNNLLIATWAVPPPLLENRLPPGVALDLREGNAFVSLVAFEFLNTRVFGISWPGYRNFGEINLRFYVRHGEERGVVFIREFVPQRFVAWMARFRYNEPYLAAPLTVVKQDEPRSITLEYRLRFASREQRISVAAARPAFRPGEDSDEHFFKEEHWGYGTTRSGQATRYFVDHPVWEVYPIGSYHIDFDFANVYGPEWGFLGESAPMSVALAVGSAVSVSPKGRLRPQMVSSSA